MVAALSFWEGAPVSCGEIFSLASESRVQTLKWVLL